MVSTSVPKTLATLITRTGRSRLLSGGRRSLDIRRRGGKRIFSSRVRGSATTRWLSRGINRVSRWSQRHKMIILSSRSSCFTGRQSFRNGTQGLRSSWQWRGSSAPFFFFKTVESDFRSRADEWAEHTRRLIAEAI